MAQLQRGRMKHSLYLIPFLGSLLLTGCVNLKTVNTFGLTAVEGLQQGKSLPSTFTDVYRQRIEADSLSRHPFGRTPIIGIDFVDRVRRDSLRSYQLADSLTLAITDLTAAYFQSIADFSSTGDAFKPVQLKSPSFDQFLQTSKLKLTKDQTAAVNRLFNLLGSAATETYRRRKLGELLTRSHDDAQRVLSALAFSYERLADVVDISREQQYGYYRSVVTQDPTLTYQQKHELARQWLETARNIEQTRQAILTYVNLLKTIQMGYREVYKNRYLLKDKELIGAIGPYINKLKQLRADLEHFRPANGRLVP